MLRTRTQRTIAAVSGAVVLLFGLASCALVEGPTPATPQRPEPPKPSVAPEFVPGGSAEDNLPFFREILTTYAAGEQPIEGQPIVDAIAASGFDKAAMQVSFDRSKTNLVADSIYVSVRFGTECLLGQLVTEGREAVAETAKAVGPEQNICLIGNTRTIDW